jgi:hypothetical protein
VLGTCGCPQALKTSGGLASHTERSSIHLAQGVLRVPAVKQPLRYTQG